MSQSNSSSSGGIGFFGLLTILFIGLKLGGVIVIAWWWVLSPLWIPVAFLLFIAILVAIFSRYGRYRQAQGSDYRRP